MWWWIFALFFTTFFRKKFNDILETHPYVELPSRLMFPTSQPMVFIRPPLSCWKSVQQAHSTPKTDLRTCAQVHGKGLKKKVRFLKILFSIWLNKLFTAYTDQILTKKKFFFGTKKVFFFSIFSKKTKKCHFPNKNNKFFFQKIQLSQDPANV